MAIPFLNNLNLNFNELQNAKIQQLAVDPSGTGLVQGLMWMNTSTEPAQLKYYDGQNIIVVGQINYEDSAGNIQMDGTASAGTSNTVARGDHVHPSDTSRVEANAPITAGTYPKISYDAKGLVTGGAALEAADIPDIGATYVVVSRIGAANGVAGLDETGKVPAAQLPSYVDDVVDAYIVGETPLASDWLSASDGGAALTPESGVIYIVLTEGDYYNKTYRWSGTTYVEISPSVVYTAGTAIEISSANVISATPASASAAGTMSSADFTKLAGIAEGATKVEASETNGNILVDGEEVTVYTPSSGAANKSTENNAQLTPTSGVCTWVVTHNLNTRAVVVDVSQAASPYNQVYAEVAKTDANNVTISIVSSANIPAGTYTATIIG